MVDDELFMNGDACVQESVSADQEAAQAVLSPEYSTDAASPDWQGGQMVSNISEMERLNQVISELEAYEQPITTEQCHNAIKAVQELTALLRQRGKRKRQLKEPASQLQVSADMRAMVASHYAIGRADEARLQLAAFVPICDRFGVQALRRRQIAVFRLREFVQAAADAFAQQEDTPASRPRPDYLRLVESEEERTHVEGGRES